VSLATEFDTVTRLMRALTALSMIVVALEWQAMQASGVLRDVWREETLRGWWGWRRLLMRDGITRAMPWVQTSLASLLLLAAMLDDRRDSMGAMAAAGLAVSVWHTAVRVRGTMNGGSDGMLFIVLLMLALATAPVSTRVQHAAVVFVAAQVLLSYLRAGLVKARERDWWNGTALAAFLAIPAYGVPRWIPRSPLLLRVASIGVIVFELAAPIALVSTSSALMYTAVAWCFHLATAVVFGLNRFVLAWSAALPALWFAARLLHATG
jgi:hypothetical protein